MSVRSLILDEITQVAEQQGRTLLPLRDDLRLLESGLDSLCIAIIVARLDDELGIDPLSGADDTPFPVTIGDFIALYEHATV